MASKKKGARTQKDRKNPIDPRDIVMALAVAGIIALIFVGGRCLDIRTSSYCCSPPHWCHHGGNRKAEER